jgi:hypothetical protein
LASLLTAIIVWIAITIVDINYLIHDHILNLKIIYVIALVLSIAGAFFGRKD